MIESQEWEGSDILKYPTDYCSTGDPEYDGPECFEEGFDQLAIEAGDERMTSLYEKDLVGRMWRANKIIFKAALTILCLDSCAAIVF